MFNINELLKATKGKLIQKGKALVSNGVCTDTRSIKPQEAFIALKGGNFDGHNFIGHAITKGASCIIAQDRVSLPKNPVTYILVKDTHKALGDIAKFNRKKFAIPVIAVTGSNGKTTTKEMIAWVLSARYNVLKNEGTKNNHVGLPLTLLNLNKGHDLAVLEIGTNHFGEVEALSKIALANIGLITNIGPSHLEHFRSLAGVLREKTALLKNLQNPHLAIVNGDDALLRKAASSGPKSPLFRIRFGFEKKNDFSASEIKYNKEKTEFLVNGRHKISLHTCGRHNIYNALGAIALARIFGVDYETIARRLASFEFPHGRLKFITVNNIRFIDDTYNSNPLSLRQALEALAGFRSGGRKIFVMGDMLELGQREKLFHAQAGKDIVGKCDIFISVGSRTESAAEAAKANGFDNENIFICQNSLNARDVLFNKISPNSSDIVLVKGSRAMKMEQVFNAV